MGAMQDAYNSPCPGLGTRTKGHRHSNNCRSLHLLSEDKPFDVEAYAKVVRAFVEHQLITKATATNHAAGPNSSHVVVAGPLAVNHSDRLDTAEQLQLSL
jgi:hypothetical protein